MGAAIANGSQAEKGVCALFVRPANRSLIRRGPFKRKRFCCQWPREVAQPNLSNRPMSPMRFVRTTLRPALALRGTW